MTQPRHPYHREATIFFLLVALFIAGMIVLFLFFVLGIERSITSYQTCIASRTSKILETYPEICITAGGKRFVNPAADLVVPPTETASPTPVPLGFSLPNGWEEVTPDPKVVDDTGGITTHEFAKTGENRPYPVGRVTIQYTTAAGRLAVPDAIFEPEGETLAGIPYTVLIGEENGYEYRVYYGQSLDQKYFLRIFTRSETPTEHTEQTQILSSFSFEKPDMSGWQKYENRVGGYAVSSPADMEVMMRVPGQGLMPADANATNVSIDRIEIRLVRGEGQMDANSLSRIFSNPKNGKQIEFSLRSPTELERALYEKILSTFQFVE